MSTKEERMMDAAHDFEHMLLVLGFSLEYDFTNKMCHIAYIIAYDPSVSGLDVETLVRTVKVTWEG